jgi:hypothetical protein
MFFALPGAALYISRTARRLSPCRSDDACERDPVVYHSDAATLGVECGTVGVDAHSSADLRGFP